MLLIALMLGTLWLVVLAVAMGVCASAAAGDRLLRRAATAASARPADAGSLRLSA